MTLIAATPHGLKSEAESGREDGLVNEASEKKIYNRLLLEPGEESSLAIARQFLKKNLAVLRPEECDLPVDVADLGNWLAGSAVEVGTHYRNYLEKRKRGRPQAYFRTRGQALSFITKVAPTKLVDGAWLYGALAHWQDIRYRPLVSTFLEELGRGDPDQNHVLLYKELMAVEGIDSPDGLGDEYYCQGAIQLALGYHSDEFLPELIGYNLGYEQLPLHLLISAYELRELGIDPYYFTVHVTIDNSSSGHAQRAVQAVLDNFPVIESERESFYNRVRCGYMLNEVGLGSVEIIQSFDAYREVVDILKRKSRLAQVHSDYRRIKGLTVNQWLADPERIPSFLDALIDDGWIKLNRNPSESPFWGLLQGSKACMFGVFSSYEREIISEWIAGSWMCSQGGSGSARAANRKRSRCSTGMRLHTNQHKMNPLDRADKEIARDFTRLERTPMPQRVRYFIELMRPGKHHTAEGLMATRLFSELFQKNS